MGTRTKLNHSYFLGSLCLAAVAGGLSQSVPIFLLTLAVLVTLNVCTGEIRPGPRKPNPMRRERF